MDRGIDKITPVYCHQCGKKLKEVILQDGERIMYCKKCNMYFQKAKSIHDLGDKRNG